MGTLPLDVQELIGRIDDAIELGHIEVSQWEHERVEEWADRNHLSDKQIAILVKIHNRINHEN